MDTRVAVGIKYPVIMATGFLVTYLLTPWITRLAFQWGIVDMPGIRRVHTSPTPRGGGIAMFAGFHAACAAMFFLPWPDASGCLDSSWWRMFLPASFVLLGVGVADDVWGLTPLMKLAGQAAAASVVLGAGWSFQMLLGHDIPVWLDVILTMGWILLFINAFNLIDGIDGLATGLGIIAATGMAGALLIRGLTGDALVLGALIGAGAAFLRYNFHPATVFLGDSGSMFIGLVLAMAALGTGSKGTALASVGGPLLAAGIPLFDVMLTVWRRSRRTDQGTASALAGAILCADTEHVHHRLLTLGMGQPRAAIWLYAANAFLVALGLISLFQAALAVSIFLLVFIAGSFVWMRRRVRPKTASVDSEGRESSR